MHFLATPAASVTFIDSMTLEVVTPPHLPARVPITIRNLDGTNPATAQNVFEFTGDPATGFEPVLFPIFAGPVKGAFGSEFHTTPRVWNPGNGPVTLYGVDSRCYPVTPPFLPLEPFELPPDIDEAILPPACSTSTGRIFWLPKGQQIAANLRVRDVSREATSHGVEIPVVRRQDFSEQRIALLGVPIDKRFRNTLRIYSLARGEVMLNLQVGEKSEQIWLQPGRDWFEPASLTYTAFPLPEELPAGRPPTIRVAIDTPRGADAIPIWAFITVTNNETQQITTITP